MTETNDHIGLTAEIACAYVSNNPVPSAELPALVQRIHGALVGLTAPAAPEAAPKATPAQIRASIQPDALVSFEDGKTYKTLRRHLRLHGLTPEAYRTKHGLPVDYPMVTANYSARRSELAKAIGLGVAGGRSGSAPMQQAAE